MKHLYCELGDGTSVTFNDIGHEADGSERVRLYFEKPDDEYFFKYLETSLPKLQRIDSNGFTDAEIAQLLRFAADNAELIWKLARKEEDWFACAI